MGIPQIKGTEVFKITGNWEVQAKHLKAKYKKLTDADLKIDSGKETEMVNRLSTRLNMKREKIMSIIKKEQLVSEKI
jgi:phage anti-repressor protein